MASRDPAFLWETEVLRSGGMERRTRLEAGATVMTDDGDWLTLQEASDVTGVPAGTIRKWARHRNIPTFLEQTSEGYLRYVSMSGIRDWTTEIGRDIDRDDAVDLKAEEEGAAEAASVPEGSMLVPLDAWNRMLNQLGNLHEAGQQLAEARERAAKAETESVFLKERMAELREELERVKTETTVVRDRGESYEPAPGLTEMAKRAYSVWRRRRRQI